MADKKKSLVETAAPASDKKKALAKEFKFMKDFDPEKDLPKK